MGHLLVGHTTEHSVRLWLRGDRNHRTCTVTVRAVEPGPDDGLDRQFAQLDDTRDFTSVVDFGNLRPGAEYRVHVTFGPLPADVARGRFRTLAEGTGSGHQIPFSFILSSCNLTVVTINNLVANLAARSGAAMADQSLDLPIERWAAPKSEWMRRLLRPVLRNGLKYVAGFIQAFTEIKQPGPPFIRSPFLKLSAVFDSTVLTLRGVTHAPAVGDVVTTADAKGAVASSPRTIGDTPATQRQQIVLTHVEGKFSEGLALFSEDGSDVVGWIEQISQGRPWYCKPSFFLHAGDQIYYDVPHQDLAPDRKAYRTAYREAWFEDDSMRRLLSEWPHYMTLDDHEIADQFARDFVSPNRNFCDPAPKNREVCASRYLDEAMVAYEEYAHQHSPRNAVAEEAYWYTFDVGASHFFVLDTRTQRRNTRNQMIDEAQLDALLGWLERHRYDLKFVVTSVPFVAEINDTTVANTPSLLSRQDKGNAENDKWCAPQFAAQRDRIIRFIGTSGIERLVFLTGDMHCCYHATMRIGNGRKYESVTVHELAGGPVNQLQLPTVDAFHPRATRTIPGNDDGGTLECDVVLEQFHSQVNAVMHLHVQFAPVTAEQQMLRDPDPANVDGRTPRGVPFVDWNVIRTLTDSDASAWAQDTTASDSDRFASPAMGGRLEFVRARTVKELLSW